MLITRYNNIRGPICHYTVTYATAQGRLVAPREARPSATNQCRYHSSISICGTTSHCYDTQLIRRFVPMTKRKSRETVTPDRTVSISRGFRKRPRFHGRSESRSFGFPGVPLKPAFHEYAAERHCFLSHLIQATKIVIHVQRFCNRVHYSGLTQLEQDGNLRLQC